MPSSCREDGCAPFLSSSIRRVLVARGGYGRDQRQQQAGRYEYPQIESEQRDDHQQPGGAPEAAPPEAAARSPMEDSTANQAEQDHCQDAKIEQD